ncbi:hypothetical protein [Microbacterium sp.]|uniref:hypothetical protein n=1 Tax=Microbacterium sp. TaxID=51671 RepID=UPI002811D7DC|nr:hypothetical protein [Microbacterium sp.]
MPARIDKTEERAALTARLLAHPVPTITVEEYALLADRSRDRAFDDIRQGRVEVDRRGRSVRVKVIPLMRALGFEFDAPVSLTR